MVAEGQPATRLGLEVLLRDAGFELSACATLAEAVAQAVDLRPDAALLDLLLKDCPGIEAVEHLSRAAPWLPIVAFCSRDDPSTARAVLGAGASGFLRKDAAPESIIVALRAAANGLVTMTRDDAATVLGPASRPWSAPGGGVMSDLERTVRADQADRADRAGRSPAAGREPLSPRELQLLRYLAEGHTNKEIAKAMVLADDTVKKAVQTLIAKLGATDRTHAVVVALRSALID